MLQYVLTALAGIALGIVGMRVWQSRDGDPGGSAPSDESSVAAAEPGAAGTNRKLLLGAGGLVAAAIAILLFRPGEDEASSVPAVPVAGTDQKLDDVDSMIQRLAQRLEKEPNDGEGWRMLGWSYVMTQRPQQALAPYKRAMQLLPNNATVRAGFGEALVGAAGGKVTPEAKAEFDKALQLDPAEPRARYFDGLWLAQNGKAKEALDKWIALANSGSADAPWQPDVQKQIKDTAAKLGIDVSGRLKVKAAGPSAAAAAPAGGVAGPTPEQMAAASAMPADQRQASVDSMVSGLASKLAANPKNPEGWAMLLRSRMVLKQQDQAAKDLATARKALAGDAAGLATVDAAAKAVGVPGA